ncbi:carboxypeptidase regulatory-like domain-containing protein [Chitinophaga silvatica]|uniref:Carboxypeptidase regulatory-like domain-containing protein n=1 Tax=Chitinophaga silvatica TaxID=2282649 RepID=A0A3E1Y2E3_9BACT|nr:carboxypeptidase regulatory-like domain-containing protein [Chitinophaga silvatica]RFS18848.1 carboxypeptidase regulatory-like domain-containing protein [Chitinophaga silvatica]
MKKSIVGTLVLAAMVIGFSAFNNADARISNAVDSAAVKAIDTAAVVVADGGTITGKIVPGDGAAEVEAALGEEKLKGAVSEGTFTIPAAKSGTYTVTILGKSPYKNAIIKDVKVEEGKATDLGEIKLEQ